MKKLMFVLFMIMGNELATSDGFRASKETEKIVTPIVEEYEEILRDLNKNRHLAATVGDLSVEDAYASIPKIKIDFYKIIEELMPSGKIDLAKVDTLTKISELMTSLIVDYKQLYLAKKRWNTYKNRYLEELKSDRYVEPTLSADMDPNAREDYKEKAAADFRENHSELITEAFNSYRRLTAAITSLLSKITEKEAQLADMNTTVIEISNLNGLVKSKGD